MAIRSSASRQWPYSVVSERRNLRRAGTLSNSWRMSTVVPVGPAAAPTSPVLPSICQAWSASGQREVSDVGEGLAAKTHRGHMFQIFERRDFARGVAPQGQGKLVGWNAAAVVAHGNAADATAVEPHLDGTGTGIKRVFEQFLEHRRRPVNDLAGGNLADEQVGKRGDGASLGHPKGSRP